MNKTKINAKIAFDLWYLLRHEPFLKNKTSGEILSIDISKHSKDKNNIHVWGFDFKNLNTCIEYRGSYYIKAAYFNVDGTIFKVFQII